ncbi:DEAD-box ATP-dependent RNA helicase 40-like [Salvia splendens]|uniref:DEAD-box ATP-dependent RNA helicase 40-like n=1 Tax=Salvia splendens TaxID=180675 RepID=UPI001C26D2CB|nr:DEAD-box ATP-dependent RNA helicase 40-like [Salvia splendens]XP_042050683.1 DEAD-box ATP-dependent RNA helicase 40-like [Salvia splendens]
MATAEASPSTLGPRYAPDDPTLPEPWKGLIDGSTGLLYYWNPETNVTQYEKPTALPPPLPLGPPPKMNPIPGARALQPVNVQTPQSQQSIQAQPSHGHISSSSLQPQVASQTPPGQLQGSHLGPGMQHGHLAPEQVRPQMPQQPGHQLPSQMGQMPMQSGQHGHPQSMHPMPMQQGHQAPYPYMQPMTHAQQGQMYPGAPMGPPHGFQFTHQHPQYTMHQQKIPSQGPPSSSEHSQHLIQGQQLPQKQDQKIEPGQRDDTDSQQGRQPGFSPAHQQFMQGQQFPHLREQKAGIPPRDDVENQQVNQAGFSPAQNLPQKMSMQANQNTQYGGSLVNVQPNNPSVHLQQTVPELAHPQHVSGFQNHIGSGTMHGQQQNQPPVGSNMPYEENQFGRPKNPYLYNTPKDLNVVPNQPPFPLSRNQQDPRIGDFPSPNVAPNLPGRLNVRGPPLPGGFGHSPSGHQFPNTAIVRPPVAMMGPSDSIHLSAADIYRQKHEVTASGENVPPPFMTFEAAGFPPELLQEMHAAGFAAPTPIQAQSWPIAEQSRDIVAIAKTGSGKTLGYLVPAFFHLRKLRNNPQNGPTVLVLAPTRELATQIQDEAIKFGRSSRVSCTCLYGGASKGAQLKELDRGADIVVATPGRLNDILEMKRIDFRQVSLLVLDEADRMLDMGFEPQIRKIVNEIPPRRQTLMYTATWPKEVRKIASDLLVNPVQVNIGRVDELAANKSITQHVELVPDMDKQRRLEQILRSQEPGSKIIIFCSTKKLCDHLARSLGRNFGAAAIHGDKSQGERDWVLNQFRNGRSPILVATDVAARGLDIRDIRVVINYDFPTGVEDYVHRIGRTGRAGASGISFTFFSEQDWKHAPDLVKVLEGANQAVPPEIRDIALRGGPGFGKDRGMMNRFEPSDGGGGRWDSGGRGGRGGMRDGGFGGRGGMREGGFGGWGGMRDGGFGGRGGMRESGLGGRGGISMRDGNFGGRGGGRDDSFGGASGPRGGWDRGGRGGHDRLNNFDGRGRGARGRGRGRFDSNRRDGNSDRSRGRSFSRSPDRVRTWDVSRSSSRSRSRSRSRGRSRSYSRSRSRSRSWSRSRSPRSSRSRSPRYNRSRSRSYERYERKPRKSKFDQMDPDAGIGMLPIAPVASQQVPAVAAGDLGLPAGATVPSNPHSEL